MLLMSRGAPERVYFVSGNSVWSLSDEGAANQVLLAPENARIVSIAPSPGRDQVAVLLGSLDPSIAQSEVVILDAQGAIQERIRGQSAAATPGTTDLGPARAIDWSPQGDQILISYRGGDVFSLPVNGNGAALRILDGDGEGVLQPLWSPTGDRVAYIAAEGDRRRALRQLDTATERVVEVVPASEQRAVVEFAWTPDGASLLFTEGGTAVGAVSGVDLWHVDADGGGRELVASAGSVAPIARIAGVRPSPDGRAVAYQVLTPGANSAQVDSVWVRDLDSRQGFQLDVPALGEVSDLWWTTSGLLIWIEADGSDGGTDGGSRVVRVNPSGSVTVVWTPPVAGGTPVSDLPPATPVAP
jgi:hypothetical protein